jgi:hypothetical protein
MRHVYMHISRKHRPQEREAKWFQVERASEASKEGKKKWKGGKG